MEIPIVDMKKIILTALLLLAAAPMIFAQRGTSTLYVRMSDNSHLTVALDDRHFNKNGTSLTIGDLPAGRHKLEVYGFAGDGRAKGDRPQLVYRGNIKIHRGTYAECVIDPNTGDIQVNEEADNGNSSYSQRQQTGGDNSNGRYDDQREGRYDDRRMNDDRGYREEEAPRDDVYENGNPDNNRNNNDKAIGSFGTGAMSKGDMDGLKSMIRGKDTDGEKVQIMERELNGKSFTIEQVGKMMSWLNTDDSRLELAEWAYPQVTDKENYKKLGSAFTKGSYLKELDDFVANRK